MIDVILKMTTVNFIAACCIESTILRCYSIIRLLYNYGQSIGWKTRYVLSKETPPKTELYYTYYIGVLVF